MPVLDALIVRNTSRNLNIIYFILWNHRALTLLFQNVSPSAITIIRTTGCKFMKNLPSQRVIHYVSLITIIQTDPVNYSRKLGSTYLFKVSMEKRKTSSHISRLLDRWSMLSDYYKAINVELRHWTVRKSPNVKAVA